MITITYNQRKLRIKKELLLAKLLEQEGVNPQKAQGIAVARNLAVVPHCEWGHLLLKDGDQVDVLQAIQGG